ncbi:metalloregulator ArsR/SmtB family transcription factor [Rhodococcus sp. H29-C3]|uniref:helix-turn-helix transcriptional regulator n=1 Tax=Rhodococcus sp. H29-C3 TaxID=3046307 RepID=UPI0024BB81B8|nr:metalloregulator ArsR/SmtB family transcription factor [Rhodococcus sp. H29-C3]MDJ0362101.1 transcriptional regulator [Rhodococcus sp. H29-C3]
MTGSAVVGHEGQTRGAVVTLLLEEGPISASDIGTRLGLSAAGVRRHLEALIDSGEARITSSTVVTQRGRGRPAKHFQLTAVGRSRLGHTYDDLAGAAMRQLRKIGGDRAIEAFARQRVEAIVADVEPAVGSRPVDVEEAADRIADAFTAAGFAATTRQVGNGVQICQHHCPVSHVASEFPELCDAERQAFSDLLGTHVQRLATIANGDCACTTHVPFTGRNRPEISKKSNSMPHPASSITSGAQPSTGDRTSPRKELA